MKSLIKLFLAILFAYIFYCAYQDTQVNGKTFYYNLGNQFKKVIVYSAKKVEHIFSELDAGIKKS